MSSADRPGAGYPSGSITPSGADGPVGLTHAATAVIDTAGVVVGWTAAAEDLLGHPPSAVVRRSAAALLASPEDVPKVAAAADRCRADGRWSGFVAVRHQDGHRIDVGLQASSFDLDGRACIIVSAVDLARTPSGAVTAPVLEGFLTRAPIGMAVLSPDLRYLWMNETLVRYGGVPREQRLGRRMGASLPGLDTEAIEARMRTVLDTGEPVIDWEYQGWTLADPKRQRSFSTSFYQLVDADGSVIGVCYMGTDVTDRWRARERLGLLNEAGARIGTTLDIMRTAQELADVAVPRLADLVLVDLLEGVLQGEEPASGPITGRPLMLRAGQRSVREGCPESVAEVGTQVMGLIPSGDGRYLIEGEPILTPVLDPSDRVWMVEHPARAARIREFGLHSLMVVPMRARGVVLGLATFVRSRNQASFEPDDLLLAEELVARAAVCVDNARRYTREHVASLALQRSLLPHGVTGGTALQVASRYLQADVRSGVGGDWFDVIPLSGARVALVVGDVVGHGINAAATMGRLRTAVQTLADMDLPPDELLAHLDDLVIRLAEEDSGDEAVAAAVTGATCLYAVYDPVTARCTMARAGHPPPVVVALDGAVTFLDLPAGPPLGLGGLPFESAEVELPEGSLIALYTDGLIGQDIDEGMSRLGAALARPGLTLDELGAAAVAGLSPSDDIALLLARTRVLRAHQVVSWNLPSDPAGVANARRLATRQLAEWGLEDLTMVTELVVSELVTNAIRYGDRPIRLRLIRHSTLICEVFDASSTSPRLRHARTTDEGGRGLLLVAQLSHRWGTRYTADGKVIWTEQEIPGPAEPLSA
ncbi:SpoIIE family protein phosphatase [Kitasatospora herbaricolor]|uniref:SpoIIE family protein phosphatase n=1 Tax=Kitasatospora herbaricolor TaxID=68217 RepID=A0ABZ1WJV8_9ACTN|nr:SpoIIE family protein phosphatase [Kitasatospora herbaricolor]